MILAYAYKTFFPASYAASFEQELEPLEPETAPLELDELESTFVENISDRICAFQSQNAEKPNLFCLRTSKSMKKDFKDYVSKKFSDKNYSSKALDLEHVIASIWQKTKEHVQSQLMKSGDENKIFDEITWQATAEKNEKELCTEKHTFKFFTSRQIKVLLKEPLDDNSSEEDPQDYYFCSIQ